MKNMEFEKAYKDWVKAHVQEVKISTMSSYRLHAKKHILPWFGKTDVSEIDKLKVREFVRSLQDECALSYKTTRDVLVVLKMVMNYAAEEMQLDTPSRNWGVTIYHKEDEDTGRPKSYNKEEVAAITKYVDGHPGTEALGIIIALYTGMRIGELCALRWSDVDLKEERVIHVRRTLYRLYLVEEDKQKGSTQIIEGTPKTKSSRRSIPICNALYRRIKPYKAVSANDYYVVSGKQKPEDPRTYREVYKSILKNAGLKRILKFHSLRHTFATMLIESKTDPKTVSEILGHSNVATTLNIYTHPTDEAKRNAINKVMKF